MINTLYATKFDGTKRSESFNLGRPWMEVD